MIKLRSLRILNIFRRNSLKYLHLFIGFKCVIMYLKYRKTFDIVLLWKLLLCCWWFKTNFLQKPKHEDIESRPIIPEIHFKVITVSIVLFAMVVGILVPNGKYMYAVYCSSAFGFLSQLLPLLWCFKQYLQ